VWPRGVARLAGDPWAAALVAEHAITVYDRFRSDAGWEPFFEGMAAARDEMVARSGMPLEVLEADYPFVRLADLISLTFCAAWTDEQRFAQWSVLRLGNRILVSPDAFDGATIPFTIDAMAIPNRQYESDGELREAIAAAERIALRGEAGRRGR
jgi:hypothetical protein